MANDTMVDFDHGINTAIKKLRNAPDDSAEDPRYIETVARRGYRLMMPIAAGGGWLGRLGRQLMSSVDLDIFSQGFGFGGYYAMGVRCA